MGKTFVPLQHGGADYGGPAAAGGMRGGPLADAAAGLYSC
jgi:hypothetical protein